MKNFEDISDDSFDKLEDNTKELNKEEFINVIRNIMVEHDK
jgi:hypothetical protein